VTGAATLAALPALPLHEAGKYVAAAYVVVFAVVLIYVVIMGVRLGRVQRELDDLVGRERRERRDHKPPAAQQGTFAEPPLR
jgi:CcmD family protein